MVEIKNLVILGDSMSDIGTKWLSSSGMAGRVLNALGFGGMRVNEVGRFSDGKNWTDFLVEWATGETLMWGNKDLTIRSSDPHRTLSADSVLGVSPWDAAPSQPKPPTGEDVSLDDLLAYIRKGREAPPEPVSEITYVNYAEGGAIVTTDWSPKAGCLSQLREQVTRYIEDRKARGTKFAGATMHVIWIGLNDFVTAKRPDYDPAKIDGLPTTNYYGEWLAWSQQNPGVVKSNAGVGVFPAVAEIQSLVELIDASFPGPDNHFLVIDLPSVYNAIRYMDGFATPAKIQEAALLDPRGQRFNGMLLTLMQYWPGPNAPALGHAHLISMSSWMDFIGSNLDPWNLTRQAQDHGVSPFYADSAPLAPAIDLVSSKMRRSITTSDLGHPTEAVYCLIARYFVTRLLAHGYTLGRLTPDSWPRYAPFPNQPFEYPK